MNVTDRRTDDYIANAFTNKTKIEVMQDSCSRSGARYNGPCKKTCQFITQCNCIRATYKSRLPAFRLITASSSIKLIDQKSASVYHT